MSLNESTSRTRYLANGECVQRVQFHVPESLLVTAYIGLSAVLFVGPEESAHQQAQEFADDNQEARRW